MIAIMLVLSSLVALAEYRFLSNFVYKTGSYAEAWAYVEGYAELDEYYCYTGYIFNVRGFGGGNIWSPAGGLIIVSPPRDPVAYWRAETISDAIAYVYKDGVLIIEVVEAIAAIIAPPGAC